MGVAAELQADALLRRFDDLTRLVSQEHHRASPIAPVERARQIATMIPSKRVPIIHTGQVEAGTVVAVAIGAARRPRVSPSSLLSRAVVLSRRPLVCCLASATRQRCIRLHGFHV